MKYKFNLASLFFLFVMASSAWSQTVIPLYKVVPNAKASELKETNDTTKVRGMVRNVIYPVLIAYMPEKSKATGTAIIICPGGAYGYLAINAEGINIAKKLAETGIAAFVLKYRLPNELTMINREIGPLQDAEQAIKMVRDRAAGWNINPGKVGIMGFSAGGHVAATLSTHYGKEVIDNKEKTNLRPDFAMLIYPVISFQDSIAHKGSRKALIGDNATAEQKREYSNEMQVNANTPMTFLAHSSDDKVVPVANSINYYTALQKHKVKAEMHIFEEGGHGFLNNKNTTDRWFDICLNWLKYAMP